MKSITPRERIQIDLVKWLNSHSDKFNAPYGIIADMSDLPKGGKVRTVTFGMARWLDATAYIWSPKKITIMTAGSAGQNFTKSEFSSLNEFILDLTNL